MKTVYFAVVAASLISPASAGRVKEAIEAIDALEQHPVSTDKAEIEKQLAPVRIRMQARLTRYTLYQMQIDSACQRCLSLWIRTPGAYEKDLKMLGAQSDYIREKREMMKGRYNSILAFYKREPGKILDTYNSLVPQHPRLSREQSDTEEQKWKNDTDVLQKYADLFQEKYLRVDVGNLFLGENFYNLEKHVVAIEKNRILFKEKEEEATLVDERIDLIAYLHESEKPLDILDYYQSRIIFFATAPYRQGPVVLNDAGPVVSNVAGPLEVHNVDDDDTFVPSSVQPPLHEASFPPLGGSASSSSQVDSSESARAESQSQNVSTNNQGRRKQGKNQK